MSQFSIGDLASNFATRRQNAMLKSSIATHTQELTTGQTANISRHLAGDLAQLSNIEASLRQTESLKVTHTEAELRTTVEQAALGKIRETASATADSMIAAKTVTTGPAVTAMATSAKQAFEATVSALNTHAADQSLFAGAATGISPLANADEMLSALSIAVSSTASVSDFTNAIDQWFDAPGGGFETLGYLGSNQDAPKHQLGGGVSESRSVKADDQVFRDTLKAFAKAALVEVAGPGFDLQSKAAIVGDAGEDLFKQADELTSIQATLGATQARIEESSVRLEAQEFALNTARNNLLSVDSYEAASRLQEAQFQLEGLYAVTVRMSQLSLLEYLR